MVTSGGKLYCKHVFHTSCATWNQQSGEQVNNIEELKRRSLVKSKKKKH